VKISVSDEAGVLDHTFFSALLVLQFSPRSKPLPPSSVGILEPIVHFDIIPDVCGVTPSNADDVRMIRLFDDQARTDKYLDYVTTQWLRVTAELLDVEVRQRYDSFAVLLPRELLREFSGWNARVCSLAAYDNTPPFNELGAEVQVRIRVSAVPLRHVVSAAGDAVPACMTECAGAGTMMVQTALFPEPAPGCPEVYTIGIRAQIQFAPKTSGPGVVQISELDADDVSGVLSAAVSQVGDPNLLPNVRTTTTTPPHEHLYACCTTTATPCK
jgi:hypothetical protein